MVSHIYMAKSISDSPKKRGRPKTTGRGKAVMVRLHAEQLALLDQVMAEHGPKTRPEAVRFILKDWGESHGMLKLPKR
jgi:hypothetical protein